MDLQDADELPLETPLVMMSPAGIVLYPSKHDPPPPFVELQRRGAWVFIRSAVEKDTVLTKTYGVECAFEFGAVAAKFKTKLSPAGRIVFLAAPAWRALVFGNVGTYLVCRDTFWTERQSWTLLYPIQQPRRPPTQTALQLLSAAASNENEPAGRRQVIMQLLELGKSCEDVRAILKLLYGSTAPLGVSVQTANRTLNVERWLHILKLLDSSMSTKEVDEIAELLYGTNSPLTTRTQAVDLAAATLAPEETQR